MNKIKKLNSNINVTSLKPNHLRIVEKKINKNNQQIYNTHNIYTYIYILMGIEKNKTQKPLSKREGTIALK